MAGPGSLLATTVDGVRGFDRGVYVVAIARLVNVFGSGLVYPFATIHFHLAVGIPLSLVGLGLLANSVATAGATVAGGILADRRGRKPVMVASMALSAVAFAAYAAVEPLAAATPLTPAVAFGLVATVAGFAVGLYTPAGQAMTADLTGPAERDRAFSLLKLASNLGFGAGLAVGGLLYGLLDVSIFLVDGVSSAVVALLLVHYLDPTGRGAGDAGGDAAGDATGDATGGAAGDAAASVTAELRDWLDVLAAPRIALLFVLNVGFAVQYAQMRTTVPVVAEDVLGLGSAAVGALFVLNPLTIAVLQLPVVAWVSRYRRSRGLVLSAAFWGASVLAVWAVWTVSPVVGVALVAGHLVLRTVGEVLHQPLAVSLASDLGGAPDRGTRLSVLELGKRLGFGLGSFVGGLFFDAGARQLLWPVLAVVAVGLVVGLLALERALSPAENGLATE